MKDVEIAAIFAGQTAVISVMANEIARYDPTFKQRLLLALEGALNEAERSAPASSRPIRHLIEILKQPNPDPISRPC